MMHLIAFVISIHCRLLPTVSWNTNYFSNSLLSGNDDAVNRKWRHPQITR